METESLCNILKLIEVEGFENKTYTDGDAVVIYFESDNLVFGPVMDCYDNITRRKNCNESLDDFYTRYSNMIKEQVHIEVSKFPCDNQ